MCKTTSDLLKNVSEENDLTYIQVKEFFSSRLRNKNNQIKLISGAKEVLQSLQKKHFQQFVYTHKSNNAVQILEHLNIAHFFSEVITSSNDFKKKPDPEAINYLINKYNMDPKETYYIGDRNIDIELAVNAGIKSINLIKKNHDNIYISELTDIIQQKIFD
ncbi:MAG TPA: HAD-IA family hydrolase [Lactovum miscens]|uniref:HAD-IA family hydrolase n=1 Tax=Lactovum miscens TaxID=190387 RepID=UPI002ED8C44D